MKNQLHDFPAALQRRHTPAALVAAGALVALGDSGYGVAVAAIPANTEGVVNQGGVFSLPKATGAGTALNPGTLVTEDPAQAGRVARHTATQNLAVAGVVWKAASDSDATVQVFIFPTVHQGPRAFSQAVVGTPTTVDINSPFGAGVAAQITPQIRAASGGTIRALTSVTFNQTTGVFTVTASAALTAGDIVSGLVWRV